MIRLTIDYKEIGRRIAKRRKELSLKQREVCEMIDVNYKYLSNLETGRSAPSLEMIMRLSETLQTTPDYFLIGSSVTREIPTDGQIFDRINSLDATSKLILNDIIDIFEHYSGSV